MSLRWWMLRALRAERRARTAEQLAAAAMERLSDDELLELRNELGRPDSDS